MSHYDAPDYWRNLLTSSCNLQGVSWPGFATAFLQWQYRARRAAVLRVAPPVAGKRVLDIGPGTGYWVSLWHELGAASVVGMDITAASVGHLTEQFPQDRFYQGDIATTIPPDGPYDLISAIDVLLHITDDAAYDRALQHLRQAANPGAALLLIEPLSAGQPRYARPGASSRVRSLAMVRALLNRHGWQVRTVQPALWLLNNPIETEPRALMYVLNWLWHQVQRGARHGRVAGLAGTALYPFDRLLCRLSWGPTSRIVLAVAQ
jgi:SAM-dependent methyltransferase